ncbi:reverse transcriptase domain-containing protein [Tanacetum coccineum]
MKLNTWNGESQQIQPSIAFVLLWSQSQPLKILWEWCGIANMALIQLGGSGRVGEMILARERSGASPGGFSLGSTRRGKGRFILPDAEGPNGIEYTYVLRLTFPSTNNEAEYEALLAGLRIARQMNISVSLKIMSRTMEVRS